MKGIARSTYYDAPKRAVDDIALVEAMHAIKDEFEAYGWRRAFTLDDDLWHKTVAGRPVPPGFVLFVSLIRA